MIRLDGAPADWPEASAPTAVTCGVFDGVHFGHRSLLALLDQSLLTTVLTFEPHPVEVLVPGTHPRLLTTVAERIELLADQGIRQVGVLDLADIRHLAPEEFVTEVLVDRLRAAQVVVGSDYRFGHDRAGDAALLERMGADLGFETVVTPLLQAGDGVVSSTRIRNLVAEGRVADAADALGSLFRITGTVVPGDRRGRELGFPTANLEPPARKVIPADGVYAGYAVVGGSRLPAAINVGVRPTFGEGHRLVEAFILDFDGDLYGETIGVEFADWLRPEARFDSVDDLVAQMDVDVDRTRQLLGNDGRSDGGGTIPSNLPVGPRDSTRI